MEKGERVIGVRREGDIDRDRKKGLRRAYKKE